DGERPRILGKGATEDDAVRCRDRPGGVRRQVDRLNGYRRRLSEVDADRASIPQFLSLVLPRLAIQHPDDELREWRQLESVADVERYRVLTRQPDSEHPFQGSVAGGRRL